jgi:hypothetical protein
VHSHIVHRVSFGCVHSSRVIAYHAPGTAANMEMTAISGTWHSREAWSPVPAPSRQAASPPPNCVTGETPKKYINFWALSKVNRPPIVVISFSIILDNITLRCRTGVRSSAIASTPIELRNTTPDGLRLSRGTHRDLVGKAHFPPSPHIACNHVDVYLFYDAFRLLIVT